MNYQEMTSAKYLTTEMSQMSDTPTQSGCDLSHVASNGAGLSRSLSALVGPIFLLLTVCGLGYLAFNCLHAVGDDLSVKVDQARKAQLRQAELHKRAISEMKYNSQQQVQDMIRNNQEMLRHFKR
jgi:membrane protease subunit (stomatin/prohibitin family)